MTIEDRKPIAAQDMERQVVAVSYEQKRDITPSGKDAEGKLTYLAIGMTTTHVILKTLSGKHYACPCPEELVSDLWPDTPTPLA